MRRKEKILIMKFTENGGRSWDIISERWTRWRKKFGGMRLKLSNFSVVGCSIPKNIFKTSFSSLDGLMCPSSPRGSTNTHKKKEIFAFFINNRVKLRELNELWKKIDTKAEEKKSSN